MLFLGLTQKWGKVNLNKVTHSVVEHVCHAVPAFHLCGVKVLTRRDMSADAIRGSKWNIRQNHFHIKSCKEGFPSRGSAAMLGSLINTCSRWLDTVVPRQQLWYSFTVRCYTPCQSDSTLCGACVCVCVCVCGWMVAICLRWLRHTCRHGEACLINFHVTVPRSYRENTGMFSQPGGHEVHFFHVERFPPTEAAGA